jgi:hypothetical protein
MTYQCHNCGAMWSVPGLVCLDCPFCHAGHYARQDANMLARAAMRHNEEQLKRSILAAPETGEK